jgi:hypothetical protein
MFWPKSFEQSAAKYDGLDDPLARVTQARSDETAEQRRRRLLDQEEAQHVSRKIDESLQEAKDTLERRKKAIKVLLLGEPFLDYNLLFTMLMCASGNSQGRQNPAKAPH